MNRRAYGAGNRPSRLRREARQGYDLLVMGSRGRGRVAATLLGSTVQEILSAPPIPIVVAGGRNAGSEAR